MFKVDFPYERVFIHVTDFADIKHEQQKKSMKIYEAFGCNNHIPQLIDAF